MPSPTMPGLQAASYVAGRQLDDELAGQAGGDVLDLAHDPVAGGVDVELGDLAAVVGHRERAVPGRQLLAATSHVGVGGGDRDRRRAAAAEPLGRGVGAAAGGQGQERADEAMRRPARVLEAGHGAPERARRRCCRRAVTAAPSRAAGRGEEERRARAPGRRPRRPSPARSAAAVMLNMPESSAPYQVGGRARRRCRRRSVARPGQDAGLLEVVHAVLEDAGGDEDQQHAADGEELA